MRILLGTAVLILLATDCGAAYHSGCLRARSAGEGTHASPMSCIDLEREPDQDAIVEQPPDPLKGADPRFLEALGKEWVPSAAPDRLTVYEFIEECSLRWNFKFVIDHKAFKAVGIDPDSVLKKELMYPKGKGKLESQVLREFLAQVKCRFVWHGDTVFVTPARK